MNRDTHQTDFHDSFTSLLDRPNAPTLSSTLETAILMGTSWSAPSWAAGSATEEKPMKNIVCAVATATAVLSSALLAGPAGVEATQLAQVDIQVGPPPGRVEPEPRPGVVIEEERRRPGVVIGGPEGRPRDCTTRSQSETRNGVTVDGKGAGVHPLRSRPGSGVRRGETSLSS